MDIKITKEIQEEKVCLLCDKLDYYCDCENPKWLVIPAGYYTQN